MADIFSQQTFGIAMEMTSTIPDVSQWIRDYGHDPRHMQRLFSVRFDWHQLWTALDIVEDIDLAMDAYTEGEFPSDPGEQYLRVYGIFQALFVQQDALEHFVEVIRPGMTLNLVDVLKDVRETRNATVGHPTKLQRKGETSAHGISRITMTKEGFDLLSFSEKNGMSFRYVPVLELIAKQRGEALRILSDVVAALKKDDEEYKSKFREKNLKNAFKGVSYAFEKISQDINGDLPAMGKWGADQLRSSLNEFQQMLAERGLSVETYDSIKYRYEKIDHALAELQKFFTGLPTEVVSRKSALTFADALRLSFSELIDIAQEIDEEYAARG